MGQLVRVAFGIVLISVCCALLAFAQPRAKDPAVALQRAFEAAKSSLAAGNVREAEQRYRQAIVVALRQLANLSVSESRFDEATRELEEALKVSPGDADAAADAAIASFRAGNVERARQLERTRGEHQRQPWLRGVVLVGFFAGVVLMAEADECLVSSAECRLSVGRSGSSDGAGAEQQWGLQPER